MIIVAGPRVVRILENSSNLVFSRPTGTESSLVVGEDIVDL